jgi:hypothetical protein
MSLAVFVTLFAFWPHGIWAQSSPGYVPSLNATVTSVRFFEGPPGAKFGPRAQRTYFTRFDRTRSRMIFWEINLKHPAPGRRIDYTIETIWHAPSDRDKKGNRAVTRAFIQRDWTFSYWSDGGSIAGTSKIFSSDGKVYTKEKPWPIGSYRVDFYIRGEQVASGTFEMVEDKGAGVR